MFSKFFIERPIFASVISIIIMLAGVVAIKALSVEQYPNIVPPEIQVSAVYPGATSEVLADTVAAPLEQAINGVNNMIYMYSTSTSSGYSTVNVVFDIGTDPDQATIDVNNKVQSATSSLPAEVVQQGITVEQKSSSILQVVSMTSNNPQISSIDLSNYALLNILDEIRRIKGVGSADFFANQDYSMRIWLQPDLLADFNLTPQDVVSAIEEQNTQFAAGKFGQEPLTTNTPYTYSVKTKGRLLDPDEFGNIILRADNSGASLKLKDVARIEVGAEDYSVKSKDNGKEAVVFAIYLQSGANAIDTAKAVKDKMAELSKKFPEGIEYKIPFDTTVFVEVSIEEVLHTFLEAVILVIFVVYLFLQNFRATLIPILAVPVSIIGTFAGMLVLGFSINLLTLFGLVLAIGIVVDDAIIVLENTERIMAQEKLKVKEATIKAMSEVGEPIIAVSLVMSAVFLPIAFLGGLTGQMYRQFAVTIAVSVLLSALVAMTLTPSLCAMIIKDSHGEHKPNVFFRGFNALFDKITNVYLAGVKWCLINKKKAFSVFGLFILGVLYLFRTIPTGLVPSEDQGYLMVSYNLPPASSLSRSVAFVDEVEKDIMANPLVENVIGISGFDILSSTQVTSSGISFVVLDDWKNRKQAGEDSETLAKLFTSYGLSKQDGIGFAFNPPAITGMSTSGGVEGYIQNKGGKTPAELADMTNKFVAAANKRPELSNVKTLFSVTTPQYEIDLDREKAKSLNVSITQVFAVLQSTFGSLYVNDFTYMGRNFRVTLQSEEKFRRSPDDLRYVYAKSTDGKLVPLSALITVKRVIGPELITRFNVFPAAKIMADPASGYSSGQTITAMEEVAKEVLGSDYELSWIGSAYQEKLTGGASTQAFIFGIIMVFLILAAQYERWSLPFVVIISVPFAIFGALLATWLRGLNNDLYFQVGLVTLIGLSAKNAILIVEFAMEEVKKGKSYFDGALEAAKLRFRPIVMTSLAFTFGCLPLVISTGAGAGSRHAIGTGMVGGMIASTFIATIFVPMFFASIGGMFKQK
ncbi:MAG: multidrug efflux RND transporter permease subunit [Alphaproteobacteria bacterium]